MLYTGFLWNIQAVLHCGYINLLLQLLLSRFSRVRLCVTPYMVAHQAPPFLGFSRQEHWNGLPFPSPMHESVNWKQSRSVVSDSLRPHGLQPTTLLCSWDFSGKNTGVGCHYINLYFHKQFFSTLFPAFNICRIFDDGQYDLCMVIPHCNFHLNASNNYWCWVSFHVFFCHLYVSLER